MKQVAGRFGVTTSAVLWRGLAARQYERKLQKDESFRLWYQDEGSQVIEAHWGHYLVEGDFDRLHLGSQLYEVTRFLRERIGDVAHDEMVLDAGASDGSFLARLGVRGGVGVNFLRACGNKIRDDGAMACVADVQSLPFPDKSMDLVLCCETIEHVLNPIATINELARVCRGRIHITIPWLPRTRINAKPAGWPDQEGHIFEFSQADFERVVTFSDVNVVVSDLVHVFPQPRNPLIEGWLRLFMYPSFFPKLQYYELEPKAVEQHTQVPCAS